MRQKVLLSMLVLAGCVSGGPVFAQEVGKVISSTAIVQQVTVPRQVCSTEQVAVQPQKSGAGALMGAVAGGAIGNQLGRGAGNVAATFLGMVGGALVGDKVEGQPAAQVQNVQQCATQNFYENRTVGYNVIYEYAGKRYSVQMPQDPGPTINLQVTPISAESPTNAPVQTALASPATVTVSPVVTAPVVAAPVIVAPPYPPVSVGLEFGFWGGRHWH